MIGGGFWISENRVGSACSRRLTPARAALTRLSASSRALACGPHTPRWLAHFGPGVSREDLCAPDRARVMDDCECEVLSGEMDPVGAGRGAYVGPAARRRERGSLERESVGG